MSRRRETTPASIPARVVGDALEVGELPTYGFGTRSLMWWGTAGMMAIEGTAFAFMVVVYFYLRSLSDGWPYGAAAPDLLWGTINLVIILAAGIPNWMMDRAAVDRDLPRVRALLVAMSAIGVALLGVRAMEFTALNVGARDSAYGSVVWVMLGLHTFNLVTDVIDFFVVTAVFLKADLEGKHYVDVAETAGYWNFILVTWIPIYALVYWAPRF